MYKRSQILRLNILEHSDKVEVFKVSFTLLGSCCSLPVFIYEKENGFPPGKKDPFLLMANLLLLLVFIGKIRSNVRLISKMT